LSTIEYVILLALVAVVGFVVWQMLGRHASERNRGASTVVNGLATHTTEEDHGGAGRSGRGGAGGSVHEVDGRGGGSSLHDIAPVEETASDSGLWRWGLLAAVVFGGMMFWLAKKSK
jgi:HAMP domain-containing protein